MYCPNLFYITLPYVIENSKYLVKHLENKLSITKIMVLIDFKQTSPIISRIHHFLIEYKLTIIVMVYNIIIVYRIIVVVDVGVIVPADTIRKSSKNWLISFSSKF